MKIIYSLDSNNAYIDFHVSNNEWQTKKVLSNGKLITKSLAGMSTNYKTLTYGCINTTLVIFE